ncbi:MAG: uroporphyrinogen-III C-methyltransferase, partial [Caldimonas sp.]
SVALTTAVTHDGQLGAGRQHADTEVFYMAGKHLAALARKLVDAGWPQSTPALVVSRAGWADEIASEHALASLGDAALLHSGRPTVVTVGAGAARIEPAGHPGRGRVASAPAEATDTTP